MKLVSLGVVGAFLSLPFAAAFDDASDGDEDFQVVNSGDAIKYPEFVENSSVRFDECRVVRREGAEGSKTEHLVVFRLCPADSCASCDYNYGEYVTQLGDYLFAMSYYLQLEQHAKCDGCEEACPEDGESSNGENVDGGVDCDFCFTECLKMEYMEENGYMEAMEFGDCQLIFDDGEDTRRYVGPTCTSDGSMKIKIRVFTDEDCQTLDPSKSPDDYLQDDMGYPMRLSYSNLKRVQNQHDCFACQDSVNGLSMNALCEQLYDSSDKCEEKLELGNDQEKAEEQACEFIQNVRSGKFGD